MSLTQSVSYYRERYHAEQTKPVRICPQTPILLDALTQYDPISVKFAGSGSWQGYYAVTIEGGPDSGKRVDTYPWRPEDTFEYAASLYNGDRAEFDATLGYPSRPSVGYVGDGLHAVTVAFLSAMLIQMRQSSMAEHILELLEKESA